MYKKFVKRAVDVVLSFFGLIVLIPLFVVVGIAIYIDDPGPVVFKQQRLGENKKPFCLHKFRSMKMNTPQIPGYQMDNPEQYITRVGKVIRKFSIDELPQIYDIFVGNMSIVGPRPAQCNEEPLNSKRDRLGIEYAKPGLTGWAQINGRDEMLVDTKVRFDGEYVETLKKGGMTAFMMDFKCFVGTIKKVLTGDGVVEGKIALPESKERELIDR